MKNLSVVICFGDIPYVLL